MARSTVIVPGARGKKRQILEQELKIGPGLTNGKATMGSELKIPKFLKTFLWWKC